MSVCLNPIQVELRDGISRALSGIKNSLVKLKRHGLFKVENGQFCNRSTLDLEVEWIKDTLTDLLNKYSKIMRVTPYSKRWWNKDVAQVHKI